MYTNEYIMNRRRYDKWATPKFWKLPVFYIYCFIFIAGVFGWVYFKQVGAAMRWQSIGAFLTFVAVYRGIFFQWMHADKTFRVMRSTYFNDQDWKCKIHVTEKRISLFINGKLNNQVEWEQVRKLEEAKTYYKLTTDEKNEGILLDKECFTHGTGEAFVTWMKEEHPEIEQGRIAPAFDK